jgi:branched-chain amino acid aminotransferase
MSPRPDLLMLNSKIVPYEDARVHVLSSAFKYGMTVYEGLRAYANERTGEIYGFRLRDHFNRLLRSMKVARMATPSSAADFERQLIDLVRANKLHEDLHMRVQVYVDEDDGRIGATGPVSVAMAAIPMGRYFAKDGVHVQVSSWTRISEADLPPRIKAAANYHNSRLALLQAKADGYDDAVLLGANGKVTEGPGYNLFMVRDGVLCTPPTTDGILEGITRDTLLAIAREDLDVPVAVRSIDRTELYVAEEVFFCGSAAEITPILSVDRHQIGEGTAGPISRRLLARYLAIARGEVPDRPEWRTLIA